MQWADSNVDSAAVLQSGGGCLKLWFGNKFAPRHLPQSGLSNHPFTMAKGKPRPPSSKPHAPNPHLYARISFLYQSAQLLAQPSPPSINPSITSPLSRFYLSTARTVAQKSVLRLSPSLKQTICRRCDALLIPGTSSTHRVENNSRGGRKSWADVLVVECNACGTVKRFPVGMEAKKRPEWKPWGERPGVVIGKDEEKDDRDEAQKGNTGKQWGRKLDAERTESLAHPKIEKLAQQNPDTTV